jgi:hypothetical protein
MAEKKTPMVRFLFEEARRAERAAERAKKREDDAKASRKLQEEVERLAATLWAGRDDHTAGLLREGIRAMQERDKLRLKADLYDEVTHYLTRCGYGYPSAVENMPTATQMAEHALNHRSAIQGFEEAALSHLGVSEEWQVNIRNGQMDAFFEAFEGADMDLRKRHSDLDRRATETTAAEQRALTDFTGALEEVRRKLCLATGMPSDATWELLVPAVEAMSEGHQLAQSAQARIAEQGQQIDQLAGSLKRANEERESILMALKTVRDVIVESDALIMEALGGEPTGNAEYASDLLDNVRDLIARRKDEQETWGTERGSLKAEIARLAKEVGEYRESGKARVAEWKRHVWNIAAALGVPRVAMGQVDEPNVDQIVKFINQNVLPMVQVARRVDAIEQRLQEQEPATHECSTAEVLSKAPQITCAKCGAKRIEGVEFCPSCGQDES